MNRSTSNCGQSFIPLPKTYSSPARQPTGLNLSLSPGADCQDRWKLKYEDAELKRRALLTKSEKSARDLTDLERKFKQLSDEHSLTKNELKDKDAQLLSLRNVSEKVYKEYDTLKNQYDVETGAMHKAMEHAGQWYKENRQLKRKSAVLVQKYLQIKPNGVIDINIDDTDSGTDDLEGLRKTVADMSKEIAVLQSELSSARLQEFEATEQCVNMTQELEQERTLRLQLEDDLKKLRASHDHLEHVSKLVAEEVAMLRQSSDRDRETALTLHGQAKKAIRERDILARQSAILLDEIEPEARLFQLLHEHGELKNTLEIERLDHTSQIADLLEL